MRAQRKAMRDRERFRRSLLTLELDGSPDVIIRTIKAAGLEGVYAKQRDSIYLAGHSGRDMAEIQS